MTHIEVTQAKPALLASRAFPVAGALFAGSLVVALCAQVAVPLPWTPVPMTLQPFGVLLVALLYGPRFGPWLGAASMIAYLLEGAAGLPVLAPGFGGLLPLGPSAGYLLSYPLAAWLVGLLAGPHAKTKFLRALAAAAAGDALILLCGTSWLGSLTHASPRQALALGILPFLAGDGLKVVLAAGLVSGSFHWAHTRAARRA